MDFVLKMAQRIESERKRLGLSQEKFAAAGGVKRAAQNRYEKGLAHPDTKYLIGISNIGADITFILNGPHEDYSVDEAGPSPVSLVAHSIPPDSGDTLGERLKKERQRLQLKQSELAKMGGVSSSTQSKYENGESKPDTDYLKAISGDIDIGYLINGVRTTLSERLRMARVQTGLSQSEAADKLDVTRDQQVGYESGTDLPNQDYLNKAEAVLNFPGLSAMFKAGLDSGDESLEAYTLVQPYDPKANGGKGGVILDNERAKTIAVLKVWLHARGLTKDQVSLIEISDDRMAPSLNPGDHVLVTHNAGELMDGPYVFNSNGKLVVNQIQVLHNGNLLVSCKNDKYGSYTIAKDEMDDVEIIGRVVSSLHEWYAS